MKDLNKTKYNTATINTMVICARCNRSVSLHSTFVDLVPGEMLQRWASNKPRCETCQSVDFAGNNGKNVTCKLTGAVVHDINNINFDCPLNK